jgi:molecular chaperone DnaK (HSP70)
MNEIGFDFGTGNSVLSSWLAGKAQIYIPKGFSTPNTDMKS